MENKKTGRNAAAVAANFLNSAGGMKDRRANRGGASNHVRGFMAEYEEDRAIAEDVSHAGEPEPSMLDMADDDYDDWAGDYSWLDSEPDDGFRYYDDQDDL